MVIQKAVAIPNIALLCASSPIFQRSRQSADIKLFVIFDGVVRCNGNGRAPRTGGEGRGREEEREENEKSEAVICLDLISMPIAARGSRKDVTWTSLKESPASVDKRTALMHGMLVTLMD